MYQYGVCAGVAEGGSGEDWHQDCVGRTVWAGLRHSILKVERTALIERVFFLADPVGVQAYQKQAWFVAFCWVDGKNSWAW